MTVEVATLSPQFEQSVANELRQLEQTQTELQDALAEVDEKIARVERFKDEHFEPYVAPRVDEDPEPVPTPPTKAPAKGAKNVAKSIVQDPPAAPTKPPTSETEVAIIDYLRKQSTPVKGPQIYAAVPGGEAVVKPVLVKLAKAGKVQREGVARGTTYAMPSGKQVGGAKPAAKKAAPSPDAGTQQPRLEGRVFSLLQYQRLSSQALADELDADVDDVRKVLAKMLDEDEVKKFGDFPYDTWEGTGL